MHANASAVTTPDAGPDAARAAFGARAVGPAVELDYDQDAGHVAVRISHGRTPSAPPETEMSHALGAHRTCFLGRSMCMRFSTRLRPRHRT